MAKKHSPSRAQARKPVPPQQQQGQRLQEAVVAFRRGDMDSVLAVTTGLLKRATDPDLRSMASRLIIEAHLRMAAATPQLTPRLAHLQKALQYAPDAMRLHYHYALTLWGLGHMAEALSELASLKAYATQRPELPFLHHLACIMTGQPAPSYALPAPEADMIGILQAVLRGTPVMPATLEQVTLPGQVPALWEALLALKDKPKSAPVARFQAIAESLPGGSAIVQYYLGVVAMRKGDAALAQAAWRLAADAGLATPWFVENYTQVLRAQAHVFGQEGRWHDLIALLQGPQLTPKPDTVLEELLAVAHAHLGYAAAQTSDWNTAAQHWQEATTHRPSRVLFQNLALAREALGQWRPAATAWREMLRRRPRKQDHPEAVTEAQMALFWRHVAECYERVQDVGEVLTCLKNAVKYAPDDLELGIKIADISRQTGRDEAAARELERLLHMDAQYIPALLRLGSLYESSYEQDPMPIWRRVLAIDPQHEEAREALAQIYVKQAQEKGPEHGWFSRLRRRSEKEKIALLQEGLRELPGHPALLLALGEIYADMGKTKEARTQYTQAWEAAPRKANIVAVAIHNLLHVKGGDVVRRLLPTVRQITGLAAMFWVQLGSQILHCQLGQEWVDLFWTEALTLAEQGRHGESLAHVLLQLFEAAHNAEAPQLATRYEARLRAEYPHSGAVEFMDAYHAIQRRNDRLRAIRLLRQAQRLARQANEIGIATMAEQMLELLQAPPRSLFDLLAPSGGRGRRRRGTRDVFDEMLDLFEEEARHDFYNRRF